MPRGQRETPRGSRDVAEGVILALYYGTKGEFVNLGSGQGYSIKELVETLNSFLDFNYQFDITKPSGFPRRVMNIDLAKQLINYNPTTSLRQGLEETWQWFVANQDEYLQKQTSDNIVFFVSNLLHFVDVSKRCNFRSK